VSITSCTTTSFPSGPICLNSLLSLLISTSALKGLSCDSLFVNFDFRVGDIYEFLTGENYENFEGYTSS